MPLAKQNAEDDSVVDVYELVINGQEISPGYSELNDPDVQRARLEQQSGGETQKLDEDFLHGAGIRHASRGRHRHRHRPAGHDADRGGKHSLT